jgi:hypothetical protein
MQNESLTPFESLIFELLIVIVCLFQGLQLHVYIRLLQINPETKLISS